MTEDHIKVRDLPPTAVRLAPDLRHALAREAAISGRSLHGEIVHRLRASIQPLKVGQALVASEAVAGGYLPDGERSLLAVYRKLTPEKQLALLSLLR